MFHEAAMHQRTATRAWVRAIGVILVGSAVAAVPPAAAASPASGASVTPSGEQVDSTNPEALIKSTANTLLQDLDQHRKEYRQDPAKLRMLVNQLLLPHFDTELAARGSGPQLEQGDCRTAPALHPGVL